ncbi:hypothetical protein ACUXST_000648 [Sphingomonas sp. F9_3S_D5_B_2]
MDNTRPALLGVQRSKLLVDTTCRDVGGSLGSRSFRQFAHPKVIWRDGLIRLIDIFASAMKADDRPTNTYICHDLSVNCEAV